MTKREELKALAERAERAEGADRELDAAIWREAPKYSTRMHRASGLWSRGGDRAKQEHVWAIAAAPRYTASLDAAMGLVPEGWGELMLGRLDGGTVICEITYDALDKPTFSEAGVGASCALAVVIAALRARAAGEGGQ